MSTTWQDLNLSLKPHESEVTNLGGGDLAMLVVVQLGATHAVDASVTARIELDVDGVTRDVHPLIPKTMAPASSRYITAVGTHFNVRVTDVRLQSVTDLNDVRMKYRICPLA